MRHFVDLHTHSTASDGALSPRELVRQAEARRLAAVALTDHDTTEGLRCARAEADGFSRLRFINGIEVSAKFPSGTLHILGLGIDERSPALQRLLGRLRAARRQRNPKIITRLRVMGLEITMADVLAAAGAPGRAGEKTVIGRMHIAETLRLKGYVRSTAEAFEQYLGDNTPAFVDKERVDPAEAIAAIHRAGGVAVLAHPIQLRYQNRAQLEQIVRNLLRDGLDGIEAYHGDHTARQTHLYLDLARRLGLVVTGGSDFHGPLKPQASLGRPRVPIAAITARLVKRLLED